MRRNGQIKWVDKISLVDERQCKMYQIASNLQLGLIFSFVGELMHCTTVQSAIDSVFFHIADKFFGLEKETYRINRRNRSQYDAKRFYCWIKFLSCRLTTSRLSGDIFNGICIAWNWCHLYVFLWKFNTELLSKNSTVANLPKSDWKLIRFNQSKSLNRLK